MKGTTLAFRGFFSAFPELWDSWIDGEAISISATLERETEEAKIDKLEELLQEWQEEDQREKGEREELKELVEQLEE